MAHNYEVGTRAWQPDTTEGWVGSEVVERKVDGDKVTLVFNLDNGEVSRMLNTAGAFEKLDEALAKSSMIAADKSSPDDRGRASGRQQ